MFSEYYQSELTYLRELGREFALANPELAALFAERGGDPDVERLLEGFAFLTARIRERIDDAVPEIVGALTQLLMPHYLRSIPACSVVQFAPNLQAMRGRVHLPRGTELGARPVRGTTCLFRTTTDLDLLPLSLTGCTLDASAQAAPVLRLSFRCIQAAGPGAVFGDGGKLRLFLHGPLAQTSSMFLWLTRHLRQVRMRLASGRQVDLDPDSLHPVSLDPDHGLLPWPRLAPEGPRLLQEYFTLPSKLLFVELDGLSVVGDEASEEFAIELGFERPPPLPERVEPGLFRLHCVPVANLFEVDADPVRVDPRVQEHLLRASGVDPHHMEIYSVDEVTGIRSGRSNRRQYSPFFSFRHATLPAEQQAYYTLRRARSPIDGALDSYLSVVTPRDVRPDIDPEVLSISATCTNRLLPSELRAGDISVPTARSPTIARFENITEVTVPAVPPIGSELYWRLISHLSLNLRSLGEPGALQAMVGLYNFQDPSSQRGRANQLRSEAIRDVRISTTRRLLDGAPVRGFRTDVVVDEGLFAGEGDVFLFGCALDALLGAEVPINAFNQLFLKLHPSETELRWPPRSGDQPIL